MKYERGQSPAANWEWGRIVILPEGREQCAVTGQLLQVKASP